MKKFKSRQAWLVCMMLILSVFFITGCGSSDEAALVAAPFDSVLPGTCGETGPEVTSATPASGTVNVLLTTTITAYFSEAMDPTTIEVATPGNPEVETFTLYDNDYPGIPIEGTVVMSAGNTIATFTPTADLAGGTTYTVTITKYAKSASPNFIELGCNYRWEFQTITP